MWLRSLLPPLLQAIAWFVFPASSMAIDNAMLWTEEVQTRFGPLQVTNFKYPYFEQHRDQLTLNNQVVFTSRNVLSIRKAPVFRVAGADLVIMEVSQGGSGCPSAWRILAVTAPDKAVLTREIASCSNPDIEVKQVGDSLVLSPEFCQRDYGKPFWTGVCWHEIWRYSNGNLAKLRETPRQSIKPHDAAPDAGRGAKPL